jgi:type IV secretory pathway VirB3-like protein
MMPSFILLLSLLLLLLLLLSLLLYIYIYLFSYLFICIVTYHYFRIGMCSDSMDKGQRWRYRYGMIWRDIHIKAEKKLHLQ